MRLESVTLHSRRAAAVVTLLDIFTVDATEEASRLFNPLCRGGLAVEVDNVDVIRNGVAVMVEIMVVVVVNFAVVLLK